MFSCKTKPLPKSCNVRGLADGCTHETVLKYVEDARDSFVTKKKIIFKQNIKAIFGLTTVQTIDPAPPVIGLCVLDLLT